MMKIDIASKWIKDNIVAISKRQIEGCNDTDAKRIYELIGYTSIEFEITQHNLYKNGEWSREYTCIIYYWMDIKIYHAQFFFYHYTMKQIDKLFKQIENEIQQENSPSNNIAPVDN